MSFNNNSSQKEREQFVKDTFHSRTHDESGGRWQKQVPTQVNGTNPATLYPKLPSNSPWSGDPVPPEEPLGIDVTESPIVGEPHEVWASQQPFSWMRDRSNSPSSAVAGGVGDDGGAAASTSSDISSSTSLSKPRASSEDGVTNRDGVAPSSKFNIRRRLV